MTIGKSRRIPYSVDFAKEIVAHALRNLPADLFYRMIRIMRTTTVRNRVEAYFQIENLLGWQHPDILEHFAIYIQLL
jgi:hypothetical protein